MGRERGPYNIDFIMADNGAAPSSSFSDDVKIYL